MSSVLLKQRLFVGFSNYHVEQAFLKSTFNDVWEKEPEFLQGSCTRFREEVIANPYVFRYWQFAKNKFYPKKRRFATIPLTEKSVVDRIEKAFLNPKVTSMCLNDTPFCSEEDFKFISNRLLKLLEQKHPNKSSFEK